MKKYVVLWLPWYGIWAVSFHMVLILGGILNHGQTFGWWSWVIGFHSDYIRVHGWAKASSATDAVQQAKSTSKVAAWSDDEVACMQIADLQAKPPGNRNRDFVKLAQREGYMLSVPITLLKDVPLLFFFQSRFSKAIILAHLQKRLVSCFSFFCRVTLLTNQTSLVFSTHSRTMSCIKPNTHQNNFGEA